HPTTPIPSPACRQPPFPCPAASPCWPRSIPSRAAAAISLPGATVHTCFRRRCSSITAPCVTTRSSIGRPTIAPVRHRRKAVPVEKHHERVVHHLRRPRGGGQVHLSRYFRPGAGRGRLSATDHPGAR